MLRALPSFTRIVGAYNDQKFYRASLEEVIRLHDTLETNRHDIAHRELPFAASIELREMVFRYGDKTVIERLNVKIKRGSSVAFVGGSGAGKSTLLDVLMGVRQAASGTFLLDGTPFDPFACDALSARSGYVPQKVNLMDSSIAFNIAFQENYDRSRMAQVIEATRLDSLVRELRDGLETAIGEDGVRLSGGQRQRIGLARALYRNPDLVVLDEATSALDSVTEREIMEQLQRLPGSRTLILVTHRLSAVEWCDQIHLLAGGRIVASGSHAELMQSSPQYRALCLTQGEGQGTGPAAEPIDDISGEKKP
jgi:ABC-type bacteriocin/lantibiotic exporter with double-glycine peptidase domain